MISILRRLWTDEDYTRQAIRWAIRTAAGTAVTYQWLPIGRPWWERLVYALVGTGVLTLPSAPHKQPPKS